jgi:EAL domain-containing protein (putative c-di-GMP-specific phosphodiesterase class I)
MTGALQQQAGISLAGEGEELRLATAFQPIVGLIHQRVVGYEALVRATSPTGRPVTPCELFDRATLTGELLTLDTLCQRTHLGAFARLSHGSDWLFLNVRPESVVQPSFPEALLERASTHGLEPQQVVIELLETPLDQPGQLERSIAEMRALGFVIALDDFGAGHSNLDRVLDLKPDLIKLDRQLLLKANHDRAIRRVLPTLISLLHEIGTLVVAEGIETSTEASISLDSGADFGQGFFFGLPSPDVTLIEHVLPRLELMRAETTSEHARRNALREARLEPHRTALRRAARMFAEGAHEGAIATCLLALSDAARCYTVSQDGMQYGNVYSRGEHVARFLPLDDESGANWESRPYFRDALRMPGEVVATFPYLSISGNYMCVTLATAVVREGRAFVLGVDVDWD